MIIEKLSVNGSVQFLGLSNQVWGSGFLYISNLLAQVDDTGWVSSNNYNRVLEGRFNNDNNIVNAAWVSSVDASPTNSLRSPGHPPAA